MVNPSVIQQLAREYRRDDLAAVEAREVSAQLSRHAFRERVGWSLVGLGMRLTRDPFPGAMGQGRHVQAAHAVGAARPGAPRARASLPLARL